MSKARLEQLKALAPKKILTPLEATYPLDPLIAPMVVYLREHDVDTIESCQGGVGHKCPFPTILFKGDMNEVDRVRYLVSMLGTGNKSDGDIGLSLKNDCGF